LRTDRPEVDRRRGVGGGRHTTDTERLLLKTNNSRLWAAGRREFAEDYVYIKPDAAEWAVRRQIRLIGTDYLSIEQYASERHAVHRTLLGNEIVVLEAVNLSEIRPGRYELICLPLLVPGCDGAPARVVLVEE